MSCCCERPHLFHGTDGELRGRLKSKEASGTSSQKSQSLPRAPVVCRTNFGERLKGQRTVEALPSVLYRVPRACAEIVTCGISEALGRLASEPPRLVDYEAALRAERPASLSCSLCWRGSSSPQGAGTVARLVQQAAGRITLLCGGGVTPDNAAELVRLTGATELHSSAKRCPRCRMRLGPYSARLAGAARRMMQSGGNERVWAVGGIRSGGGGQRGMDGREGFKRQGKARGTPGRRLGTGVVRFVCVWRGGRQIGVCQGGQQGPRSARFPPCTASCICEVGGSVAGFHGAQIAAVGSPVALCRLHVSSMSYRKPGMSMAAPQPPKDYEWNVADADIVRQLVRALQ